MKKNNFESDVFKRMAEILDALSIPYIYDKDLNGFKLSKTGEIITKKEYKSNFTVMTDSEKIILLSNDGKLQDANGEPVVIKHCETCKNYVLLPRRKISCPFHPEQILNTICDNEQLPNWYEGSEDKIIDKETAENHLNIIKNIDEDKYGNVLSIINSLLRNISYVTISDEKIEKIRDLKNSFPNMEAVIDYILDSCNISKFKYSNEISFKPICLVGAPGCGKTEFTKQLVGILFEKSHIKVDLGNGIADFSILGSDPSYKNSKPGLLIEAICSTQETTVKNPCIHFDELDKINTNQQYNVTSIFYSILEKSTSCQLYENFIGMNIDASGINYIFTANSLENISNAILSRLHIFTIENYTLSQLKEFVLDSFFKKWIKINKMQEEFLPEKLSNYIKDKILKISGTDTRKLEEGLQTVFNETVRVDNKTKHSIALFSPDEIYTGWEQYRGHKKISTSKWKLPEGPIQITIDEYF